MIDIDFIKSNPNIFDKKMQARGEKSCAKGILDMHANLCQIKSQLYDLQNQKNKIASEIPQVKKSGGNADALIKQGQKIRKEIEIVEEKHNLISQDFHKVMEKIPNIIDDDVPEGKDESDNKEVLKSGTINDPKFKTLAHYDIAEKMGQYIQSPNMSGTRFVMLFDEIALLERAVGQFMLDLHTAKYGYVEVSVPFLVNSSALYNTGQFPNFCEGQVFKASDDMWMIPTSEVPLTNIVANQILGEDDLPKRYVSLTPCFRQEAGSHGKDTRGMIRLHQFMKVELVSIVSHNKSDEELEHMLKHACSVLDHLEIPYRVMLLSGGDIGFHSKKTYDIEVWMPSESKYREISSCSNCGDFVARRMKTKVKIDGRKDFVHTLNGSGLAVGRTVAAILENYQMADGTVKVPDVLIKYMGGKTKIGQEK